ncbi:hypothetical protein [Xenorhabdus sp. KJ12.1]|uniref:hypothetical protein n=1 Tax=Xenorhabdus sp. KJ12.1 TaxID=1851571 RepID=UPI000C048539|nr:hypothetical protein [Xenorhabdus sp. KJ12.1]PHM72311.1 hypothetical protein Xekj_00589 [Xenorhabdus sp. KJ12.1]
MDELQTALQSLSNNGSWVDAIIYSGAAFIGFLVLSALMRSMFLVILGAVAAFYVFSLQAPDYKTDQQGIAPDNVVSMMIKKSNCAADSVDEIKNIGQIIRNGNVLDIAKECKLIP